MTDTEKLAFDELAATLAESLAVIESVSAARDRIATAYDKLRERLANTECGPSPVPAETSRGEQ